MIVDDRAIMLRSFGHALDLIYLLLDDLPDTEDYMHARQLAAKFRELIRRSVTAHDLEI